MQGWNLACPDWEARILAGKPPIPDLPLFEDQAEKALRIFKRLKVPDIQGTPTHGEICDEWVFAIVRAIFGSYEPELKRRMIREFFLLIPKKNGKSSVAAAIIVVAAIMNTRPEAELLLVAPTKKIADIAYKQAAGIIRLDPALAKLFHSQAHQRTITHRVSGAAIIIKAADKEVITGSKATFILIDETHVFATSARAEDVFVEIRGSLAARPEGFLLQITTQSKEPPAGVFKHELQTARDVRDGVVRLPVLAILYEFPPALLAGEAWRKPEQWHLVNPNLGRSVDEAYIADELLKAERQGPAKLALIASQHLNVEIGIGLRSDRWPGAEHWQRRADPSITLEAILERCEVVVIGADGGGLDDLFSVVVLGRDPAEIEIPVRIVAEDGTAENRIQRMKRWLAWSHSWCHKGVLDRRQTIAPKLLDFERAGELTIVGDELGDVAAIVALVERVQDAGLLGAVWVDPAGLGELVDALALIGVTAGDGGIVSGAPQGYAMMTAIKTAERRVANGTLLHAGQAIMAWAVANLKIEPTATAIRATKQNAGDAKIDPAMALFDAVTGMMRNPEPAAGRSVFEALAARDAAAASAAIADDDIDPAILTDPRHPLFQQMRERFEARLSARSRDEDYL